MSPRRGDMLCDMGSGAGRFAMHAALRLPLVSVVGIELSSTRHAVGLAATARASLPNLQLVHGDAASAPLVPDDPSSALCRGVSLVYMANLLFDSELMRRLCARVEALESVRTMVTLRRVPEGELPSFGLTKVEPKLGVTWSGSQQAYVYERGAGVHPRRAELLVPTRSTSSDETCDMFLRLMGSAFVRAMPARDRERLYQLAIIDAKEQEGREVTLPAG